MGKFSIKGLIKFGQKEHLEALLDEGIIYMNNIDYFRRYEKSCPGHLRGDRYECFDRISQHNTIIFFDESPWEIDGVTVFENRNTYPGYLYCMYAIHSDNSNPQIDNRMLDFGEYAVIILNPREFIDRILSYCAKNHLCPNCFPVQYYDESIKEGLLHPFEKRDKYAYQSEARIYIHATNPQEQMVLRIGALNDIAFLAKRIKIQNNQNALIYLKGFRG